VADPVEAWQRLLRRLASSRPAPQATPPDARLLHLLPDNPRPAAVLVGLIEAGDGPGILLTVRAAHLRKHAGQIAFPGGVIETDDDGPVAAALREACEEVGLEPSSVELLGYLPALDVLTGYRITPVVARLPTAFVPRLDAGEVASSFVLPFAVLLDPVNERRGLRTIGDVEVPVRDLQYGEHRIWGATAGMLFALRELALA
jgi:8-oxo-dGTP pyrophosphatase MutT (NUDIX family)